MKRLKKGRRSIPDEEAGELLKPFLPFLPPFFGLVASLGSTRHLAVGIKPQEALVPGFGQLLASARVVRVHPTVATSPHFIAW